MEPLSLETQSFRISMPVAWRNREPIRQALAPLLPPSGLVLELASGSGEHAIFLGGHHPELLWQPSDLSAEARTFMEERLRAASLPNICPPVAIDASAPESWPVTAADAILAINLTHISPWRATTGLFRGGARLLPQNGLIALYGPFFEAATSPAMSNMEFDAGLRMRNPEWGLRRVEDIEETAQQQGFRLAARRELPQNNLLLAFRRI